MLKKMKLKIRFRTQFRFIRQYFVLILFCLLIFIVVSFVHQQYMELLKSTAPRHYKTLHLPKVVVHFDLKGAPPDITHLRSVLRHIKDLGADAILLEYEDMFPYDSEIKNLSSPFHYNRADLVGFLKRATHLNLEVIPLIQTFGHMEHALKLEEFKNLREHPIYPDSICPSENKSLELLKNMIGQVVFLHKYATPLQRIHIGCDEVRQLNNCPACTKRGLPSITLYIHHLKSVAKMVKHLIPDIQILMWDDMFRGTNISLNFQKELELLSLEYQIQPVVWDYSPQLSQLSHKHLHLYQKTFKNMWVASAYKGADGLESVAPNLTLRLLNNLNWLKFMNNYSELYNFSGIILTGWSRYSHFLPICDLLPVSYRSLANTLMLIKEFNYHFRSDETNIERFSLKDWEVARKIYLDDIFKRFESCAMNTAIRYRYTAECSLNTEAISALHGRVVAYENALKKNKDTLVYFNLEARIKFGYIDLDSITNFVKTTFKLYMTINERRKLLKKQMRLFFSENVYNEYISYKSYSADDAQASVYFLIKELEKKVNDPSHNKVFWSRGRNFSILY